MMQGIRRLNATCLSTFAAIDSQLLITQGCARVCLLRGLRPGGGWDLIGDCVVEPEEHEERSRGSHQLALHDVSLR
jgi:hypothetical protein